MYVTMFIYKSTNSQFLRSPSVSPTVTSLLKDDETISSGVPESVPGMDWSGTLRDPT